MKKLLLLCIGLVVTMSALPVCAAPLKIYVAGVSAVGVPNRNEMQVTIQTLLASRLTKDTLTTVGSAGEADVVVSSSYVVVGSLFSLDAVASTGGKTVVRSFVQGEKADELIPAVGKLADKLAIELAKVQPGSPAVSAKEAVAASGDIVKITEITKGNRANWRSPSLQSAMNLVNAGPVRSDGSRDIFIADNRHLFHYLKGTDLKLVAEKELKVYDKIIALDVLDTGTGGLELYVTCVRNEQVASQIWQVKGDSLHMVAEGLPYFFRVLTLPGSSQKLYAQKVAGELSFAGDVFEAERSGVDVVLKKQLKLPRLASLYTFNQFTDAGKNLYTVAISPENKLVVFDREQREVWRSSELYGGSELFMERKDLVNGGDQGPLQIFRNQRIHVTSDGNVLVGKNEAIWSLGKTSNYKNGAVYCLAWDGDHLEGKWHTRIAEYYMPDYFFDDERKELLQLELTGRPNILSRGSTIMTIRIID